VIAQAPKLAPTSRPCGANIAKTLGLDVGQVNVKAKTAEKLGPVGQGRVWKRARWCCLLL
jgi:2-C-methyl-D-erythritol 2,4-cyclodiphosphate synthase